MSPPFTPPLPGVLLYVEDDVDHAFLVTRNLRQRQLGLDVEHQTTVADAVRRLHDGDVRCVLLDLSLPDAVDMDGLHRVLAAAPEVPVVVLTGLDSDEVGVQALQQGAQDYLVKGRDSGEAIARAVWFALERASRHQAEARQALLGEELRLREVQLSEAQRLAGLGSWDWDLVSGEVRWSAELLRLSGMTSPAPGESGFAAYLALVHDDDRPATRRLFDVVGGEVATQVEHRLVRPDGSERWVQGRHEVLARDAAGRPVRVLGTVQDVTEQKLAREQLARLALHDGLTGLVNRGALLDRLRRVLGSARVPGHGVAVVFLDLDHFKWVNDNRGHDVGDRLLVEVARRLQSALRPTDTLARFGGDEFVLLCESLPAGGAEAVVQRLRAALAVPQGAPDPSLLGITVTASMGVATAEAGTGVEAELLVRDADIAMYVAKARGRDCHAAFDESMRTRARARLRDQNELVSALAQGQLVTYFQPVMDLSSGLVLGTEALVRWRHPHRGLLLPGAFVPHAEETGLVVPLGSAVLHRACQQTARWNRARRRPLSVAVNLSARQLVGAGLLDDVRSALASSGLSPALLTLEVTETAVMLDADASAVALADLRALGVRIAIDDFGTGWSSLAYLLSLPVDVLKVDRSFVAAIGTPSPGEAIVSSVLALAATLGLGVVAEGVETESQRAVLQRLGVLDAQGWLWGPAVPADQAVWAQEPAGPRPPLRLPSARPGGVSQSLES